MHKLKFHFKFIFSLHLNLLVSSKPTKKKVLDHVIPNVIPKWYEIGLKLLKEEQEQHLDVIKSDHPGDNTACCTEMFWYWLRSNDDASWLQLIDALHSPAIELYTVASKLEKIFAGS